MKTAPKKPTADLYYRLSAPLSPEVRLIPLTRGQSAIVDAADFEWLSQWKWSALYVKKTDSYYAVRTDWNKGKQIFILMHRLIAGTPLGQDTDHRNRKSLDNRRDNLRPVSHQSNTWNQAKRRNNTSGFKGVVKSRGKWMAQITVNGKHKYLGRFTDIKDAVAAYDAQALLSFGEFAVLNNRAEGTL